MDYLKYVGYATLGGIVGTWLVLSKRRDDRIEMSNARVESILEYVNDKTFRVIQTLERIDSKLSLIATNRDTLELLKEISQHNEDVNRSAQGVLAFLKQLHQDDSDTENPFNVTASKCIIEKALRCLASHSTDQAQAIYEEWNEKFPTNPIE